MFIIYVSWKDSYFLQIKKLCFIHADNLYWYIDFPKLLTPFFWFQYTKIATHSPLNKLVDAQSGNSHNILLIITLFRFNMEKFAGQPIDTLADSRR